jgi:hypothetical protein
MILSKAPLMNEDKKPYLYPWWFSGLHLVFVCLMLWVFASINRDANIGYLFYSLFGFSLLGSAVTLIINFYKQRAQYTIKSILIVTCCVAVFCSIYTCFGQFTLILVYCAFFMLIDFLVMFRIMRAMKLKEPRTK